MNHLGYSAAGPHFEIGLETTVSGRPRLSQSRHREGLRPLVGRVEGGGGQGSEETGEDVHEGEVDLAHEGGAFGLDDIEEGTEEVLPQHAEQKVLVEGGMLGRVGYLQKIAYQHYDELDHLRVGPGALFGGSVEVVGKVHDQTLPAHVLGEGELVAAQTGLEGLLLLWVELRVGRLGQHCQQGNYPEGKLLVLVLQHQQFEEVGVDDVEVGEDEARRWAYSWVSFDELD